ncbi:MAG: translocation/assembly module TamB domain-containing protein [bacterium]|jgi:hypothetical protein
MSRKKKGLAYFGVVLCILLLGVVVVFTTQSERIAINLGGYLTAQMGRDRNITFDVGDIGGNLFRNVVLKDFVITYTGAESPKILFTAREIYVSHNPASLIFGKVRIDSVGLVSPRIVIPRRADGSWVYPFGDSRESDGGSPPVIEIRKFGLTDGSVFWEGGRPAAVTELDVNAVYMKFAEETNFFLNNVAFLYDARTRVKKSSGYFSRDRRGMEVHFLEFLTEKSSLGFSLFMGGGGWDTLDVRAEFDSLAIEDALSFYGGPVREDFGTVKGVVTVQGSGGRYGLDAHVDGNAGIWDFENLDTKGLFADGKLAVNDLTMVLNGTPMMVTAEYAFSEIPEYKGVVSFTDMDVATLIKNPSEVLDTDMNGEVAFSGRGLTAEDFTLDTWPHLGRGRYRHYEFDSVDGYVKVTSEDVTVDATGKVPYGDCFCRGYAGYDGGIDLEMGYDTDDIAGIEAYHPLKGLGGSMTTRATLQQKAGYLTLEVRSVADSIVYRGVDCDSLVTDFFLEYSDEGLEAYGRLFGANLGRGDSRAEELIADFEIDDRHLSIDRLVLTRSGGSLFGVVGELDFVEGGFDMTVDNIFVEIGKHVWENSRAVDISYGNDSLVVSGLEVASEMGAVSLERSTVAGGFYDLQARVKGLDMGLFGMSTGTPMPTGTMNLTWDIRGHKDSLGFNLDFELTEGEMKEVPYDSFTGHARYEADTLIIDDFVLRHGDGSVVIDGTVPVNLSPGNLWSATDPDSGPGLIDNLGTLRVEARDIDITLLSSLAPPLSKFRGRTSLSAEISGRRDNPRIVTHGRLDNAEYGLTELGRLTWDILLEDSLLTISEFDFGTNGESGRIKGGIPVAVTVVPFSTSLLERPVDLEVVIEGGNLGLLADIFPKLKECEGRYDADLRITGQAKDPYFEGYVNLSGARIRLEGMAQDLRDIYLNLAADGQRFDIRRFEAEEGALKGSGYFTISGLAFDDWNLALTFDDYWVSEYEDFFVRIGGDIVINRVEIEPGQWVPNLEGDLKVHEGEYYFSLAGAQTSGGFLGPTRFPGWLMNVEVEIPNKFWIRGDDIQAEVQGTVNVKRSGEGLLVLGTLKTIRGTFAVYNNIFKIVRGEVRFSDVTSIKKAYINLEAEARVLDERIEVVVNGFLDNVDVSATSESGWSETQIFEALTVRRVSGPGEDVGQEAFAQALLQSWGMALLNRFGTDVARELRLDRFGIEIDDGASTNNIVLSTRVTFGKYVTDNVYLQYTESLGNLYGDAERLKQRGLDEPERRLQVEYRLSDRFTVEGEAGTVRGLGYFDVDLKFRYGY